MSLVKIKSKEKMADIPLYHRLSLIIIILVGLKNTLLAVKIFAIDNYWLIQTLLFVLHLRFLKSQ
jgi:hypothetical protein